MKVLLMIALLVILFLVSTLLILYKKYRCAIFIITICIFINYHLDFFVVSNNLWGSKARPFTFRVMTYNMNITTSGRYDERDAYEYISEIEKYNPDILCLQECHTGLCKPLELLLDSLFQYKESYKYARRGLTEKLYSRYPLRSPMVVLCDGNGNEISKDSIAKKYFEADSLNRRIVMAETEVSPNNWVTVVSVHLCSNAYSNALKSLNGEKTWFSGIPQYIENIERGSRIRRIQADRIIEIIDNNKPTIIAGDFNDLCGSSIIQAFTEYGYRDSWSQSGFGFGFSYIDHGLRLRLDHILFNDMIGINSVYVPSTSLSDHRPLIADLYLKSI